MQHITEYELQTYRLKAGSQYRDIDDAMQADERIDSSSIPTL